MLYLAIVTAYLGAVTALVAAWKKFIAAEDQKANLTIYVLAGVLALPLLFAFFFNILPAIRRRRERYLRPTGKGADDYFDTGPRLEDPYGFFRDKCYEPFLTWTREPKAPLLHLTGLSGSGKSSLLCGYLQPNLAKPGSGRSTRLFAVRGYHDPLIALKEKLLGLWKKKPDDYDELTALDAVRRAARHLSNNERLIVAFDQFEEFFLLRAIAPHQEVASDHTADVPVLPDITIAPLRGFLRDFCADPPENVTLLLCYREDHRRLLASLNLPARTERENWMTVDPLDFAAAAAFLHSCPGLAVPDDRMQRVLCEAARQEGGRVVMRPIVANLLGLVLRQMSSHPKLWRRTGDLLRGYVRDCLGAELAEDRARVLRALLTDFHTARPRPVAEIAREARLDPATLDTHLEHLGRAGLLRCLNRDEPIAARRVWQIAHDFLATLIERVLDGLRRTLWRNIRPWLAPAAIGAALIVAVAWPSIDIQLKIRTLTNAGFSWNDAKAELVVATDEARRRENLDRIASAIHRLHPRALDLRDCAALENIDGIKGLVSLRTLDLSNCVTLQNVDVLKGLTSLQDLRLNGCRGLKNLDGIKGLTSLQHLALNNCNVLQNVDGLKGLASLVTLDLSDCDALENIDGLEGLTSLERLDLSISLEVYIPPSHDSPVGAVAVKILNRNCRIEALRGLISLKHLSLSRRLALRDIDVLRHLAVLKTLDLSGCTDLQNVDVLRGLTCLESLDLKGCNIPKESWSALATALSKTRITFPDGSKAGPQERK